MFIKLMSGGLVVILLSAAPATGQEIVRDTVGHTYYFQQSNGSTGNRVALCDDGSVYVCWTNLAEWPPPEHPRHVYFNWLSPDGQWLYPGEGAPVSQSSGAGYGNLDIIYGNRGAITYHLFGISPFVTLAVDIEPPGIGFFDYYDPLDEIFPQNNDNPGRMFWPYIAVDRNDNTHLVMTENTPGPGHFQRLGYTNSTDGGATWIDPEVVDTVMVISSIIDASPVSDRVVIAYAKSQDTTSQAKNDIYYVVSEDGTTWDFRHGKVNITNYGDDQDSVWAYTDLDVVFDYNDDIHIAWTETPVSSTGERLFHTDIRHFSDLTQEITTAVPSPVDSTWPDILCPWDSPVCKMNLGVFQGPPEQIYMTYTRFDSSDVAANGYANGEIYMTYSDNGGYSWHEPVNLTNTHTPNCLDPDCASENYATLADKIDDKLHITYVTAKNPCHGGSLPSPVIYETYQVVIPYGIDTKPNLPAEFSLIQNYPNPFNAETRISFELNESAQVALEIFDITGAKVATLVDGHLPAGPHDIIWDASDLASGLYLYRLSSGQMTAARRAVVIK